MMKLASLVPVLFFVLPAAAEPLPAIEVPFTKSPPTLTAEPKDLAWTAAAVIPSMASSLILNAPQPAVPPTEVRALWDENFLYVRFTCTDDEIFTPFTKRDGFHYQGDVAEIFFDCLGDGRFFYEIQLSARGGILDQYVAITADPRTDEYGKIYPDVRQNNYWANLSWNCPGLRTATKVLEENGKVQGWIAEFALPAKTMMQRAGATKFSPGTVRANFLRYEWPKKPGTSARDLVAQNWSTVLFGNPHQSPARMGYLHLMAAQ